jgi:NACalpha-BTF3-like transcription factor
LYQILENKQLEAHRSSIEKCIGHFKNRFLKFNGKEPFFYGREKFEQLLPIALSLDNLNLERERNDPSIITHPFFCQSITKWWDFPSIQNPWSPEQEIPEEDSIMETLRKRTKEISEKYFSSDDTSDSPSQHEEIATEIQNPVKIDSKDEEIIKNPRVTVNALNGMIEKYQLYARPRMLKNEKIQLLNNFFELVNANKDKNEIEKKEEEEKDTEIELVEDTRDGNESTVDETNEEVNSGESESEIVEEKRESRIEKK